MAGEAMDDVDFTRLNMANVERIEIVKGAASALYGSSANGGVVNIITKEGNEPWSLNVNARMGRHNAQRAGLSFGTKGQKLRNLLTATYTSTDEFEVHNAENPVTQVVTTIYGEHTVNVKDQLTFTPTERLKPPGRAGNL